MKNQQGILTKFPAGFLLCKYENIVITKVDKKFYCMLLLNNTYT